ncbi:hypothetical protein pdam_00025563, partial [Pocillopora damicornis]
MAYTGLWRVLVEQGNIDKALFVAEKGRAQALSDLMEFSFCGEASQHKADALREVRSKLDGKTIEANPQSHIQQDGCLSTFGALLVGDPWVSEVTNSEGEKVLEQLHYAKEE